MGMKKTHSKVNPNMSIISIQTSLMVGLAFASMAVLAANVSQVPMFLTTSAKPNVMLMVDNSGSMNDKVVIPQEMVPYDPAKSYLAGKCKYNSSSKKNRALSTNPSSNYSENVPSSFLGKDGKSSNNKCFDPNRIYANTIFTNSMVTMMTAAGVSTDNTKKTNYLNWYYSEKIRISTPLTETRLNIAKDAATALVDSLTDVRLGMATLNGTEGGKLLEAIDDLTDTKKGHIKDRINSLSATSWTPLAETQSGIGRYFATGYTGNLTLHPDVPAKKSTATVSNILPNNLANGTGWRNIESTEPSFSTPPVQYSCQKSFSVLVTDGLPTQDRDVSSNLQDYDGDCSGTNSSSCVSNNPNYDLKKAYFPNGVPGDNATGYLDDVSQALFEMDLRPDLTKSLGNINNIVTFAIGIADPEIDPTIAGVNPILKDAAEKGGGKFYFASDSNELSQSLIDAFSIISEQSSSSSSVATNSTQFQTDTLLYQAKFDSTDWSGKLLAIKLISEDANGDGVFDVNTEDTIIHNGKLDAGFIGAEQWDASNLMPSAANRHIYSYNPVSTTSKGIEFLWANLNTSQKQVIDNANKTAASSDIFDYLRGDQSNEGKDEGQFRDRATALGDIVNSDPLFVYDQDLGYSNLASSESSTYADFITSKKTRRPMIYVGANDGMLHGFDAGLGTDKGKEIFAYMPNSAISPELVSLTQWAYSHNYFVDGSTQYGDAFFNSTWHTVVVGSMGAGGTTVLPGTGTGAQLLPSGTGGRAIFALDVTNPNDLQLASTGVSKVLWEFSSRDDGDLGYTLAQPSIVKMANGQWAAVLGNGYKSGSGKAILYVINIADGSLIKKIEADASGANGLSTPVVVDADNDKVIDYVYAGDLKGNVWKFNVSDSNKDNWDVAYKSGATNLPVFTALDGTSNLAQPITAKLVINKAAANGQTSGYMIYFGTGKYFEIGDNIVPTTPQVQTFYGIWDVCDKTSAASCNGAISGRSALQQQSILTEGTNGQTTLADDPATAANESVVIAANVRITSNCEVGYGNTPPSTKSAPCTVATQRRGWYMDLKSPNVGAQGERVYSSAVIRYNRVIFATGIPITTTCSPGGISWLMEMDINSGSRLTGSPLDMNNDGKVDDKDKVLYNNSAVGVSGIQSDVGLFKTPVIVDINDGTEMKFSSGSTGSLWKMREPGSAGGGSNSSGALVFPGKRTSWRQLR